MALLLTGLVIFLGIHSVSIVAPGARDRWAKSLGHNGWRALYSVIALAGFVLLVYGYGLARQSPVLYAPPLWTRHVAFLLMLPVFPLLFAAYLPGRIRRATRHPMLLAVKIWAFSHLLANGMLADVLLFGAFLAWAVIDRISLKRRPPRPTPAAPPGRWNDAIAVAGGLGAYLLMLFVLHRVLIGVPLV